MEDCIVGVAGGIVGVLGSVGVTEGESRCVKVLEKVGRLCDILKDKMGKNREERVLGARC